MMATSPRYMDEPLRALRSLLSQRRADNSSNELDQSLPARLLDVFLRTWDLGFTAFGGPPVHFQIIHARFVEGRTGEKWVDEQTYQELFAICQALPGPGSTKMLFCVTLLHAGFVPALLAFVLWSSPAALAMYGLSLGVQRINEVLPGPVYALLSGLNASTVGIIALAAVQLAEKAIKDKLTRILIIFGACAGLCYNALWYFPVIMCSGGLTAFLWYGPLARQIAKYQGRRSRERSLQNGTEAAIESTSIPMENFAAPANVTLRKNAPSSHLPVTNSDDIDGNPPTHQQQPQQQEVTPPKADHIIRAKLGIAIVIIFFASFTAILLTRSLTPSTPRAYSLFTNMYLAGTIIFGGGPVVIPLLRSYVVDPGWVSSRDFLLGLAIIQAMPDPNFNFAVYLGALALQHTSTPTILGAFVAFIGIFLPGITLAVAVQGFWRVLRTRGWVIDILKGVNATAVGLVFTAVYRLWGIGYLTVENGVGQSLALEPWWVVVAAVTYSGTAWFGVAPPVAIVLGGVLGLCWYGAVKA